MDYLSIVEGNNNARKSLTPNTPNTDKKKRIQGTCFVPLCASSKKKCPNKLFLNGPSFKDKKIRIKWFKAANRVYNPSSKSKIKCCEDHFDLEKDVENWMRYKVCGGPIRLRKGVLPHKFECQNRMLPKKPRLAALKRERRAIIESLLNTPDLTESSKALSVQDKPKRPRKQSFNLLEDTQDSTTSDSIDEDPLYIKQESLDDAETFENESETSNTMLTLGCIEEFTDKNEAVDPQDFTFDDQEQFYEFGKFVAEQLMCLDIEDARIAQKQIKELLERLMKQVKKEINECLEERALTDVEEDMCPSSLVTVTQVNSDIFSVTCEPQITDTDHNSYKPSVTKSRHKIGIKSQSKRKKLCPPPLDVVTPDKSSQEVTQDVLTSTLEPQVIQTDQNSFKPSVTKSRRKKGIKSQSKRKKLYPPPLDVVTPVKSSQEVTQDILSSTLEPQVTQTDQNSYNPSVTKSRHKKGIKLQSKRRKLCPPPLDVVTPLKSSQEVTQDILSSTLEPQVTQTDQNSIKPSVTKSKYNQGTQVQSKRRKLSTPP